MKSVRAAEVKIDRLLHTCTNFHRYFEKQNADPHEKAGVLFIYRGYIHNIIQGYLKDINFRGH